MHAGGAAVCRRELGEHSQEQTPSSKSSSKTSSKCARAYTQAAQRTAAASSASTQQEEAEKEDRRNDWGSEQQQLDEAAVRRLSVQALQTVQAEADRVSSKEEVQRPPLGGEPRANSPHPRANSPIRRPLDAPKVLDAGVGALLLYLLLC
jgi:hypothetical protein